MSHLIVPAPAVKPWAIVQEGLPSQAASGTLTTNQVYLWCFETQAPIVLTGMRYKMGATATGTVDLGIYDVSGGAP